MTKIKISEPQNRRQLNKLYTKNNIIKTRDTSSYSGNLKERKHGSNQKFIEYQKSKILERISSRIFIIKSILR